MLVLRAFYSANYTMGQSLYMANIILEENVMALRGIDLRRKEVASKKKLGRIDSYSFIEQIKHRKKDVSKQASKKLWDEICNEANKTDIDSREQFIMHYAYLVNWVVNRLPIMALKGIEKDDLIGYGTIGLIEAVDRFDPNKNCSFESFGVVRIRGSIYDHLRASDHLSRASRKRVKDLTKVTLELENKFQRYPTNKELAEELSISNDELREIQKQAQIGIFSLDETRGNGEENLTLTETISSDDNVEATLEENELKEKLAKAIECLPPRERTVISLYHYKKLTFKEIAEVMSFSESRASQLHARAIALLKARMLSD